MKKSMVWALAMGLGTVMALTVPGSARAQEYADDQPAGGWCGPRNIDRVPNITVNTADCSEKSPDVRSNGQELYYHIQQCDDESDTQPGIWFIRIIGRDASNKPIWSAPQPAWDALADHALLGAQPCISPDGSTLYYTKWRNVELEVDGMTRRVRQLDIFWAIRETPNSNRWIKQGLLPGGVNTPDHDERGPSVSDDGLLIYFDRRELGTVGGSDIYYAWRLDPGHPFSNGIRIDNLSVDEVDDASPDISANLDYIIFARLRSPGDDGIYIASRQIDAVPDWPPTWSQPVKIPISDLPGVDDKAACITGDNRRILFRSTRETQSGENQRSDIYFMARFCYDPE